MNVFLKAVAGTLTGLVLWICLNRQTKDISVLLTLTVCAIVVAVAMTFLQPVMDFIEKLQGIGDLESGLLSVVLKAVGIGMIAEISILICKDAGNETMGKTLQFLATAVILWISLPVFEKLLSLLDKILGTV